MGYSGGQQTYTDKPQWFDPLGPSSVGYDKKGKPVQNFNPSGAPQMREGIFNQIDETHPVTTASSHELAGRLAEASNDPGWADAQGNARATIRGDYLNGSPQLDAAMAATRRSQMNAAADSNARQGAQFARNGMTFSTANQQANQANNAAAAAAAGNTEAQARLANYTAERQNQIKGTEQLEAATAAPLNYLENIPNALLNPLATEASLISGLSTGGPIATPSSTIVKKPGTGDYISGALSSY